MKTLAEFLEREGGHIATLVILTVCFLFVSVYVAKESQAARLAEDGFAFAIGAMAYAMKGVGNGKKDLPTKPETETPKQQ